MKRVIVDTTVMPKAIAHPTDSSLLERYRERLVRAAARHGLKLRQNYNREASRLALQIGRYAHAKQYKRMRHALRTLLMRDVERQVAQASDAGRTALLELIARTKRILSQKPKHKNKLYALHAPEVACLVKGKVRVPYEFGVKVSITTTHKEGRVVGARSMPGNPYDGHTLAEALEQAAILSDVSPEVAIADRGSRLQGRRDRWRENLSPWLEAWRHAWTTGNDPTPKRDRAGHRSHEDGWKTRLKLAQRRIRCRDARDTMRRGPQPADDSQEAAAFLRTYAGSAAEPTRPRVTLAIRPLADKTDCSGPTN